MKLAQTDEISDLLQGKILITVFGNIAARIGDSLLRLDAGRAGFSGSGKVPGAAVVVKKEQNMIQRQAHPCIYHRHLYVKNIADFIHIAGNFRCR